MTQEELLLKGLRAGIELQNSKLSDLEKSVKAKELFDNIRQRDSLIGIEQSNLDQVLSRLVLDILELSYCTDINLPGSVLSEMSERARNNK